MPATPYDSDAAIKKSKLDRASIKDKFARSANRDKRTAIADLSEIATDLLAGVKLVEQESQEKVQALFKQVGCIHDDMHAVNKAVAIPATPNNPAAPAGEQPAATASAAPVENNPTK